MERAERMILLGIAFFGFAFVVPVLWVMLGLTAMTAAGIGASGPRGMIRAQGLAVLFASVLRTTL